MLEKSLYDSWKSRMDFYIENRENGRMILDSVQNGPLVWPTIVQEDGLPPDVYAIVNHHKVAKEIWERVKLLMQGTKLSLKEKESKLYNEFNKFSFMKVQVNTKFQNSLPPEWSKKLARDLHTTNYDQLFPQMDLGLVVPVFNQGDDPISCLNMAIAFLTAVASSRFSSTNNHVKSQINRSS
ncbi:hypothetical protein Tco_0335801 [Tanacetum coccineum]